MTNRDAAIQIVRVLKKAGFTALLAGGCVRDMLLKRRAKDYDIATDAQPGDVIRLFRRTLKVGAKFGVIIVMIKDQQVEVATFRTESGYIDGRHPENVSFTNAKEDALRRDFTINGMFYDPVSRKVLDFVGGQKDLAKAVIRTIGKPRERFSEDYLRMLRAVRFAVQLGFRIHKATFEAVTENAHKIKGISGERIRMELEGMMACPNRALGFRMLVKSGLAKRIFKELSDNQFDLAASVLDKLGVKADFALTLACVYAGCETKKALDSCRELRLSRGQIKQIRFLLDNRSTLLIDNMSLGRLKMLMAEPYFEDLYQFQKAIQKAAAPGRNALSQLIRLRRRVNAMGQTELKPKPLLDGHELISLGTMPGPKLGQLSQEMYIAQLEMKIATKSQAASWVKDWLAKHDI